MQMPMLRALPAMIFSAPARSMAYVLCLPQLRRGLLFVRVSSSPLETLRMGSDIYLSNDVLQRLTKLLEALLTYTPCPLGLNLSNHLTRPLLHFPTFVRVVDDLGSPIYRVKLPFHIPPLLKIIDQKAH